MTNRLICIRTMVLIWLCFVYASDRLPAQETSAEQAKQKAWAKTPKEIAFQNDSQWEDNRWQKADVGPFITGSISAQKGAVLKGIAIRVGDRQQASVCFDTAQLRISAGWTGDFIAFGPRRFGLIEKPRVAGPIFFSTPRQAGWANGNRFRAEPDEYNLRGQQKGIVHLPKEWAAYRGLYLHDKRVVLSYTVATTNVLESPWFVEVGKAAAFIRSLEVGPAQKLLKMRITDDQTAVHVIGDSSARLANPNKGAPVLEIAPHEQTVRIKLLIFRKDLTEEQIAGLVSASGPVEDLSQMIATDSGRYPETAITQGSTTETGGPYVIDTLTLPFENPYRSLLFTAGHDFFSNGDAAVCMVHGDVWVVSGVDRHLKKLRWRRFATGLFQPLGLKIVDDQVYVIGRDQITRLHDRNGDGEADFYENFNNDLWVTGGGHEYVTCLDTDPEGNFYFIHAITGVMRVSPDGSQMTSIATGFRNPNGMTVGPDGTITVAPQQGTWTPESSIILVKPGGYYGFPGPHVTPDRPTGWDLPMCFIPRAMDNSGGAEVWVEGDRWGPLTGKMLQLSFGQCRMLLTLIEKVGDDYQGGTIQFPTVPGDFESGIMRGRFNPLDGQLYVSGLRGWQTRAIRDGCLQRVRYVGGPLHLPIAVKTYTNGLKLTFTEPLDRDMAENPTNYFAEQWNYRYSKEYGSPDISVADPSKHERDEVSVVSATLDQDGRSLFLEMPGRQVVHQLSISWLLRSAAGESFRGRYAHTINVKPTETMPDSRIVRRKIPSLIDDDVLPRLKPGLQFHFQPNKSNQSDSRTARLATLRQSIGKAPTPFLPAGPFSLKVSGTLKTALSGFYEFRLEGTGKGSLAINGKTILGPASDLKESPCTGHPVLLRKGHNRVELTFDSPLAGTAELRLWWKGYGFDWEPVPPDALFHDSGAAELVAGNRRRLGRELFADRHCARCHEAEIGSDGMFEFGLIPPDLSGAGDRFSKNWLAQQMLDPRRMRPEARMPALLGTGEQARRDAADIAAFLTKQHASKPPQQAAAEKLPDGEWLFENLGCITCHHFEPPDQGDDYNRLSLHFAAAKFQPGALAEFLRKPSVHYPGTAMPDYRLSQAESAALERHIRAEAEGKISTEEMDGQKADADRGAKRFTEVGCGQCHAIGEQRPMQAPQRQWTSTAAATGCLSANSAELGAGVPRFGLNDEQRAALVDFIHNGLFSLTAADDIETAGRLFKRLRCAHCHDRDGIRSHRSLVTVEEGSGKLPPALPHLTWAGEKLWASWMRRLLAGELKYESRPWLGTRMPAFGGYAEALSQGLAAEHGIDPTHQPSHQFDPNLVPIGEELSKQTGLDCRQCHGIGPLEPRGDENTQIKQGINFAFLKDRLRGDYYRRFMLNPPRYDINSSMIKLSEDGLTTKLQKYFDADARKQFDALWDYIQSTPPYLQD